MSRYLIERIAATPNIIVSTTTAVTRLHGNPTTGLEAVSWQQKGVATTRPVRHLFLFAGADPETAWLDGCGVRVDANGFVLTGGPGGGLGAGEPAPLESCLPGVFAVGDVRSGSVKRVGGAIGEGAAVVAQIHRYIETTVARR